MISVIIPTYNHGWALPACLDSLGAQTFQDFEIIIMDDGSTDGTETIVKEYIRSHKEEPRIRYLKIDHRGAPTARNTGARQSRGEFLLFADADLILKADMLQKLQTTLENHPEASYAYSSFRFGWKKFLSQPFDAAALRQNNYIHTTALIRRQHFTGFDERLTRFQDWDLWLTMLEQNHIGAFVDEELFIARVNQVGISRWRPRLWYRLWAVTERWTGLAPASWRKFVVAKKIVQRKHNLS